MIGTVRRQPPGTPAGERKHMAKVRDEFAPVQDAAGLVTPAGPPDPVGPVPPGTVALVNSGLFADASNFELRFVPDYQRITAIVQALRTLGLRVVLTSGSFDIIHEGHSMYLEAARRFGDFLIVGLDSDEKISARKGPHRPAVPEMERLRMVTHQRGVGLVTLKHLQHERWALIKAVRPDVLVATEETYTAADIAELEQRYCGRVEVLGRMATVSTSARLRRIQLGMPEPGDRPGPGQAPG
ncbi:MAG TPA: adenylyltransferase/cytidyltransferase family protein [Streptosporangiaceae bacterium]